jgi:hypothetical protein
MSNERWIDVTEAASILKMTSRQVNRYGNQGKLRTKKAGRRVLYLLSDVASLADELRVDIRPTPQQNPLARVDDRMERLAEGQQQVLEMLQRFEEAERHRLPAPQGPTKEELREWLREIIAEQEAARRPQRSTPWIPIAAVVLMIIAVGLLAYFILLR